MLNAGVKQLVPGTIAGAGTFVVAPLLMATINLLFL